jgi:hypothetical protein
MKRYRIKVKQQIVLSGHPETAQENGTQLCFNYGRPKTSFPPNLKNKTTSVASVNITYTITSLPH